MDSLRKRLKIHLLPSTQTPCYLTPQSMIICALNDFVLVLFERSIFFDFKMLQSCHRNIYASQEYILFFTTKINRNSKLNRVGVSFEDIYERTSL